MPSSFQAVAVIVVALLPGALYIWSFERMAGAYGVGFSDRFLRFIGASSVFHAGLAPATYWFWSAQWSAIVAGRQVSWWMWVLVVVYVALPVGVGTAVGSAARRRAAWARWLTGPDLAPRAWDHVFAGKRDGWVRLKLKSGSWVGGGYATSAEGISSYTSGYPHDQDLYISTAVAVHPETGEFERDNSGRVVFLDSGILVRWDEVEYLDFIDDAPDLAVGVDVHEEDR